VERDDIRADLAVKQGRLRDYESRLGKTFAHEGYQRGLTDLRDRLKLGLSEHPLKGLKPTAELTERIKALKAANSVEAAPEWTITRKMARAERPVTARILERIVGVRHCLDDSRTRWESEPLNLRKCCDVGRLMTAGLGTGWEANR
jgi:hypothetical protein